MWIFKFRGVEYVVAGEDYDNALRMAQITFRGALDELSFVRKLEWYDGRIYVLG